MAATKARYRARLTEARAQRNAERDAAVLGQVHAGESLTMAMSRTLGISRGSVASALRKLEERGLVERRKAPGSTALTWHAVTP